MNRRESIVKTEALNSGWEVLSKGYPDLLLYKEETNEAIFIEVKSKLAKDKNERGGELTPEQKRMHQILKKLGLTVTTIHIK
ncbi:unnamed protein product [marine sediment metagenome]|uniref:VRR-NUC domain-containing protein n=1 Tax=marine sediment metagenome TaxID=412755 RepID=X1D548_9ZZZZ